MLSWAIMFFFSLNKNMSGEEDRDCHFSWI